METANTTAIAEYKPIEAVLADLTSRHKGVVFDVALPSGMKAAKEAAKDIGQYRIALEKKRKELKEDVLVRGRLIDGEAKRIAEQLAVLEDPIVDQIKAEERRLEAERQAAIEAEQRRLAEEERARREAEERRLADERAKLNRERAEFEAKQAETRARDEEARKARQAEEDRLAAERRALEDAQRKQREEEEARARAARQEQERQEEAKRAKARAEQEKREAAAREKARKAQELLDAQGLLDSFVKRFGHLKQFARVVKAIEALKEPA